MEPCKLNADSISLLVKEHLLPNNEGENWRGEWNADCALQKGVTIRIPYDPTEINSTNIKSGNPPDESIETTKVEVEETQENQPKPISVGSSGNQKKTKNKKEDDKEESVMPPEGSENATEKAPTKTAKPVSDEKEQELTATTSVDPTGGLTGELNNLAQTTGSDPTLTIVLAIIAVLGGGAAWKFYRQHSEQKHEQEMQKLKMEAKAKGMEGKSPGPCQTVHAQLKAEVEEVKSRLDTVDKKMALTADFDSDLLERKVRKLEKWRRAVEDEEDDS